MSVKKGWLRPYPFSTRAAIRPFQKPLSPSPTADSSRAPHPPSSTFTKLIALLRIRPISFRLFFPTPKLGDEFSLPLRKSSDPLSPFIPPHPSSPSNIRRFFFLFFFFFFFLFFFFFFFCREIFLAFSNRSELSLSLESFTSSFSLSGFFIAICIDLPECTSVAGRRGSPPRELTTSDPPRKMKEIYHPFLFFLFLFWLSTPTLI